MCNVKEEVVVGVVDEVDVDGCSQSLNPLATEFVSGLSAHVAAVFGTAAADPAVDCVVAPEPVGSVAEEESGGGDVLECSSDLISRDVFTHVSVVAAVSSVQESTLSVEDHGGGRHKATT